MDSLVNNTSINTNNNPLSNGLLSTNSINLGPIAALIEAQLALLDSYLKNAINQTNLSSLSTSNALIAGEKGAAMTKESIKKDAQNQMVEAISSFTTAATTAAGYGVGRLQGNTHLKEMEPINEELNGTAQNPGLKTLKTDLETPQANNQVASSNDPQRPSHQATIDNIEKRLQTGEMTSLSKDELAALKSGNHEETRQRVIEHFKKRISDLNTKIDNKQANYDASVKKSQDLFGVGNQTIQGAWKIWQTVNTNKKAENESSSQILQMMQQIQNTTANQTDQARSEAMQNYQRIIDMLRLFDTSNEIRG